MLHVVVGVVELVLLTARAVFLFHVDFGWFRMMSRGVLETAICLDLGLLREGG